MENMELIACFFEGTTTEEQKRFFERKILDDSDFANDVAFYISAKEALNQELLEQKKQRFREMYTLEMAEKKRTPLRAFWHYPAAATVVGIMVFVSWFLMGNQPSVQQLTGKYVEKNFRELHVKMGVEDSLQLGLKMFNDQKFSEGLIIFRNLMDAHPGDIEIKKYAGITSLRIGDYNKAIYYFSLLEKQPNLFSNPGKFYKAISLLKRNAGGDKTYAEILLREVVDQNLEGKQEAAEWLKRF